MLLESWPKQWGLSIMRFESTHWFVNILSLPRKSWVESSTGNETTWRFRIFKRDYAAGAGATFLHEDDYSLWQAMTDTDQGGQAPGADAMPAVNAAGYLNAMRRRKRRQAKGFERVLSACMPIKTMNAFVTDARAAHATPPPFR